MKLAASMLQLILVGGAILFAQPGAKVDEMLLPRAYFDVSPPQPDMRILDCAFRSGRFYFLFTKSGTSELIAADADGRVIAARAANSPANHIYSRCYAGGIVSTRPIDGGTRVEEYSDDLTYVRSLVVRDEFVGGLCPPGGFGGVGRGTITSIDHVTGSVQSTMLAAAGDDPILVAKADQNSFVVIRLFSGLLQRVGYDGKLKREALLSGPELNYLRATREPNEGLFASAIASDGAGVFLILGRHSPETGIRLQKYDFDGKYLEEWRLPHLTFEEFKKARQPGGVFSNSNGSLLIGRLFVEGGIAYVVDTVNRRVVQFSCGKLCGEKPLGGR